MITSNNIQLWVDMLCDALENKGASTSGFEYNNGVTDFANKYRELLTGIREKRIGYTCMIMYLNNYNIECLLAAKDNQRPRIFKILQALDSYTKKEYNKINN